MLARPFILFVFVFVCVAGLAHAACDSGLAERLHAKLHPGKSLDHALAVCEPWRGKLGRSIVVLPLPPDHGERRDPDLDILVVQQPDNGNSERSTIVSRTLELGDAIDDERGPITEIRVDPTRYRLGPDRVAFGLRVTHRANSLLSPSWSETLALYLPKDTELVELLDEFEIASERGEWDGECAGEMLTVRGQLSVARTESHGLADLTLQRVQWNNRSVMQESLCLALPPRATNRTVTLRFDGERYRPARRRGR